MESFSFIDTVSELGDTFISAQYQLKGTEEFLKDHFEKFPVLPGVLMIEALKQAAEKWLQATLKTKKRFVLSEVSSAKFGQFIKPQTRIGMQVSLDRQEGAKYYFSGRIDLLNESGLKQNRRAVVADFGMVATS